MQCGSWLWGETVSVPRITADNRPKLAFYWRETDLNDHSTLSANAPTWRTHHDVSWSFNVTNEHTSQKIHISCQTWKLLHSCSFPWHVFLPLPVHIFMFTFQGALPWSFFDPLIGTGCEIEHRLLFLLNWFDFSTKKRVSARRCSLAPNIPLFPKKYSRKSSARTASRQCWRDVPPFQLVPFSMLASSSQ